MKFLEALGSLLSLLFHSGACMFGIVLQVVWIPVRGRDVQVAQDPAITNLVEKVAQNLAFLDESKVTTVLRIDNKTYIIICHGHMEVQTLCLDVLARSINFVLHLQQDLVCSGTPLVDLHGLSAALQTQL